MLSITKMYNKEGILYNVYDYFSFKLGVKFNFI